MEMERDKEGKDTLRVWVSEFPGERRSVWVALWGLKPNGYYGIRGCWEVRTAGQWNQILDKLPLDAGVFL